MQIFFHVFFHLLVRHFHTLKNEIIPLARNKMKSARVSFGLEFREFGGQTHPWGEGGGGGGKVSLWERCCETTERRGTRERGLSAFHRPSKQRAATAPEGKKAEKTGDK